MSWIEDDAAELKRQHDAAAELATHNSKIVAVAEKIFNDLWDEIVRCIAEANQKRITQFPLITNGDPYVRRIEGHQIIVPQTVKPPATSAKPKSAIVKLSRDRLRIEVHGLRSLPVYFSLDLGEDGVVRIKSDGENKTIQETAKLILRPLLFPELFSEQS